MPKRTQTIISEDVSDVDRISDLRTRSEWVEFDQLQRRDHDLLIRLETLVNSIHVDVKELKDGTAQRLAGLELRTSAIEKIVDQYKPEPLVRQIEASTQWIHDFGVRWKFAVGLAGLIGGMVVSIIGIVLNYFGVFGIQK